MKRVKILLLILIVVGFTNCKQKQTVTNEPITTKSIDKKSLSYEEMNASKGEAKEAFNDAKYGMFIHWTF